MILGLNYLYGSIKLGLKNVQKDLLIVGCILKSDTEEIQTE